MTVLLLGVALWWAAHLFKRVAPGPRARMGDAGRGVMAVALLAALVLMVIGYRGAEFVFVFAPPAWAGHLNNLLMLIAVIVFGAGMAKGRLWTHMRHPMLMGTLIWAVAHLMVNGDLASLVLFGGLGAWAIAEMAVINRAEPRWTPPAPGAARRDLALVGIALVMYALVAWVHTLFGLAVFGGV
jgi:uncharacterized membrane protein